MDEVDSRNERSMFGISSRQTSILITHADWIFIDRVLAARQDWKNVVELGTWYGITTLYLGMCCLLRGGFCHTFDVRDARLEYVVSVWPDNIHFYRTGVLSETNREVVRLISRPNTLVFFDNGDKRAEVNIYSKHIPWGGGFIVHDFPGEWEYKHIAYAVESNGFTPFMELEAIALGTSCRCFVRDSHAGTGQTNRELSSV